MNYLKNSLMLALVMPLSMLAMDEDKESRLVPLVAGNCTFWVQPRGGYSDNGDGTSTWFPYRSVSEMSASMSQPSMPNTGSVIPLRIPARTPREEFYTLTAAWPEDIRLHARKHYEQKDSLTDQTIDDARQLADSYKDQVAIAREQEATEIAKTQCYGLMHSGQRLIIKIKKSNQRGRYLIEILSQRTLTMF